PFRSDPDGPAVYPQRAWFGLDLAIEAPVYGIVFEHIGQVGDVEDVVHGHDFDVFALGGGAEYHSADPAESVDAYPDHDFFLLLGSGRSSTHFLSLAISWRMNVGSLNVVE